ncbi:MAG: hypothetical protein HQK53_11945 [Oligoflexia bacterium]|nr:hypothetical protein [Oligoflexia bacterium]
MQFKVFEEGIEVNGQTVYAIISGLGVFKTLSRKYLLEVGIGTEVNGELVLDKDAWYPQDKWLSAFERISKEIGDAPLFQIGESIPNNAKFPDNINNIEKAIMAIDVAYHMNHRKNGQLLYDTIQKISLEGIGTYGYEKISNKSIIISVCNNPYPCAFDRGILSAMAKKFAINASVVHDNSRPCRKNGNDSCTYIITWNTP